MQQKVVGLIRDLEVKAQMQKRWLHQLLALSPAHWSLRQSVRAAITIAGPLLLGIYLDNAGNFMMMSLAALGLAMGEENTSYILRLKKVIIITFLGSAGFFMGYLGGFSWEIIIGAMMLAAFCASIISNFSAALSAATTQTLIMATVAIAMPKIAPFWQPALMFIAGGVFYAVLLSLDALIYHKSLFRKEIAQILDAIAILADARARNVSEQEEDTYRRLVHKQLSAAYNSLLIKRYYQRVMRDSYLAWQTVILENLTAVNNSILAAQIPEHLAETALVLHDLSKEIQNKKASVIGEKIDLASDMFLTPIVNNFIKSYNHERSAISPHVVAGQPAKRRTLNQLRQEVSNKDIKSAAILALCIGIAFSTKWINSNNHWYWTPLTVIIVLKPDLGSIFARSILRVIGTVFGVFLGVVIFTTIPKGILLICILGAFASCISWASQRSYWVGTFIATPVVLIILDLINPDIHNVDYGLQRMLDTLFGGAIVLVFGYFLWPRSHSHEFDKSFDEVRSAIATYLLTLNPATNQSGVDSQLQTRRQAYSLLAAMRKKLQFRMQEPPPAGDEAVAWFPRLTNAERMCDDIGAWSVKNTVNADQAGRLAALAARISGDSQEALTDLDETVAPHDELASLEANINAKLKTINKPLQIDS